MSVVNSIRNPRAYLGSALRTYRLLLFSPRAFFEELDSRGLRKELILVTVVAALATAGSYYAYTRLMIPFPMVDGMSQFMNPLEAETQIRLQFGRGVRPLYTVLIVWVGVALLMYLVSWVYNERGRFRHLLKNTAWGMVPLAATSAIDSIGYGIVASGIQVEGRNPDYWYMVFSDNSQTSIGSTADQVNYIWGQVAEEPLVVGAGLIGTVFLVWSWYIWTHAVIDVRKIERREAYIVAAVPTVLYAAYRVITVLPNVP